jgi:hypothetical protein
MRWAGHVAFIGEMRSANSIFVGKPEGKRRDNLEILGVDKKANYVTS